MIKTVAQDKVNFRAEYLSQVFSLPICHWSSHSATGTCTKEGRFKVHFNVVIKGCSFISTRVLSYLHHFFIIMYTLYLKTRFRNAYVLYHVLLNLNVIITVCNIQIFQPYNRR